MDIVASTDVWLTGEASSYIMHFAFDDPQWSTILYEIMVDRYFLEVDLVNLFKIVEQTFTLCDRDVTLESVRLLNLSIAAKSKVLQSVTPFPRFALGPGVIMVSLYKDWILEICSVAIEFGENFHDLITCLPIG